MWSDPCSQYLQSFEGDSVLGEQRITYPRVSGEDQPRTLSIQTYTSKAYSCWDFPRGTVVKNPPANAGDTGSSPSPGRSHMPQRN